MEGKEILGEEDVVAAEAMDFFKQRLTAQLPKAKSHDGDDEDHSNGQAKQSEVRFNRFFKSQHNQIINNTKICALKGVLTRNYSTCTAQFFCASKIENGPQEIICNF